MGFDYSVDVCSAAVVNFDCVAVENLRKLCEGGKCLSLSLKNDLTMLDDTFLLKGGLNHIILHVRLLLRLVRWLSMYER